MRVLQKRNYETRMYEEYKVPSNWIIVMGGSEMDREINCAGCGCTKKYGETYTSITIHNHIGLGYPVCDNCYKKEGEDRTKHRHG